MNADLRSIVLGVVIAWCPTAWVFTTGLTPGDRSGQQRAGDKPDIVIVLTDQ